MFTFPNQNLVQMTSFHNRLSFEQIIKFIYTLFATLLITKIPIKRTLVDLLLRIVPIDGQSFDLNTLWVLKIRLKDCFN